MSWKWEHREREKARQQKESAKRRLEESIFETAGTPSTTLWGSPTPTPSELSMKLFDLCVSTDGLNWTLLATSKSFSLASQQFAKAAGATAVFQMKEAEAALLTSSLVALKPSPRARPGEGYGDALDLLYRAIPEDFRNRFTQHPSEALMAVKERAVMKYNDQFGDAAEPVIEAWFERAIELSL